VALISLNNVSIRFADLPVLDAIGLQIEAGETIGLLGRNGAGKTTLLRILEGSLDPDSGDVVRRPGLSVSLLQQDVPRNITGTVAEYLHRSYGDDHHDTPWNVESRIDRAMRDLTLDPSARVETLSAGSARRVLLAAALVRDPDLLILDEPTNHLDIAAIRHLEDALKRRRGALVFVTHDRSFLRRLADRILDLDQGTIRSYRSGYDAYLETREGEKLAKAGQDALFDKKLAQEEVWLRRGIKARRTRNEGRVRALEALRAQRRERRDETGRVRAQLQQAERSGRIVLRCRDVGFAYDKEPIVKGFTGTFLRGDRIGILGPNGCGKTTLLGLFLGTIAPQEGSVTAGTKLEVTYFEQGHDELDDTKTVRENVSDGREMIRVGTGERHIVGYLKDFLFTPDQIKGPVTKLSGGERRRLQLAKVLSRPCNVLVLDEPTNDLDLETLELIEDLLLEFQGTLLLVSHDRAFLDNIVTSTIVFEGAGRWREYAGGYEDWLRQRKVSEPKSPARRVGPPAAPRKKQGPRRLTFKEKHELEQLPKTIERLETEKQELYSTMASPDYHKTPGDEMARMKERLTVIDKEIPAAYERWLELEAIAAERSPERRDGAV